MTDGGNTALMARNAVLDGLAFRWPFRDYEEHNARHAELVSILTAESGFEYAKVLKYVKYDVIKSGKRGGGQLSALFIGGSLARHLPHEWIDAHIDNLTEVQVKFYLIERESGSYEAFIVATFAARGGKFAPAWYGPGNTGRGKSEARAVTFGRDKAGLHVTANKYRGERPGVEGHIGGEVLRKVRNGVVEREQRAASVGASRKAFPEVQYQAALRTARRFVSAVRSRGIVLTDYFKGVSYVSWERPLHEIGYDLLDADEETLAVKTATIEGVIRRGDRQLGLFEEE